MTNQRIPLIAGNWKMNLDHQQAIALVQKLAWSLKDANHDYKSAEVVVFPPFTDLRSIQTLIDADKLELGLGAQDLSKFDSGAYTGEISGAFLKKLDVKYVLVGHSERRQYHNETDEVIQAKPPPHSDTGWYQLFVWARPSNSWRTRGKAPFQYAKPLPRWLGTRSLVTLSSPTSRFGLSEPGRLQLPKKPPR